MRALFISIQVLIVVLLLSHIYKLESTVKAQAQTIDSQADLHARVLSNHEMRLVDVEYKLNLGDE